jgi:ABC-type uncharacterized transport system permease subunit
MRRLIRVLMVFGSFALALLVLSLALSLLGRSPQSTLYAMFSGAFGSWFGLTETLLRTVPILLCAMAAAVPAESGQVNIGGEGQFYLGAIGTVLAASAVGESSPIIAIPLMVIMAVLLGMLWAAIPAILRAYLGISEALVTLFLNYVALFLLGYLVHGPLRDPESKGWPMSTQLPKSLLMSSLAGTRLHSGVIVVLVLTIILVCVIRYTRWGTELRAVGLNPRAGTIVGIPVSFYLLGSMIVGGALAGLAGYYEITAIQHRLRLDFSSGFGYSGFLVAWICRKQLMLIIPIAILVAGLSVSSENLQITSRLPAASADVVQGFLLLFVLLSRSLMAMFERRRAIRLTMERV